MGALPHRSVAAGILPAVEPGRPARRIKRHELPNGVALSEPTEFPAIFPGGGTPALHGRRDVCRYPANVK
jgi:hypothetical protein